MPFEEFHAAFAGPAVDWVMLPQPVTAVNSFQPKPAAAPWGSFVPVIVSFVHSQTLPERSQMTEPLLSVRVRRWVKSVWCVEVVKARPSGLLSDCAQIGRAHV